MANDILGLEGKIAVVTGAGHGIGKASAMLLAQGGCKIVIAEINPKTGMQTAREIEDLGGDAVALTADMRKKEDVARTVKLALAQYGRIDIGVNVVGGGGPGFIPAMETTEEAWQATISQNLISTLLCSQAFAKVMRKQGIKGALVNIASAAGLRAASNITAYGAAKAGVISLTQTLAVDLAKDGIRVNAIAPGVINTNGLGPETHKLAENVVPLGRPGVAEDIAGVVVMLASPLCQYVTGQTIVVDGGLISTNPIMNAPQYQAKRR